MTVVASAPEISPDEAAARHRVAHRVRPAAVLDVVGPDRVAFLHGQLTQDVAGMHIGQTLPAAGLTPKGKLLFLARLHVLPDRLRLLLAASCRAAVAAHLSKYAAFQKVSIEDASEQWIRIGLYGPEALSMEEPPADAIRLPGEGEFAAELVLPSEFQGQIEQWLALAGSLAVKPETAEVLRIEAGRPRLRQDADESCLADEIGIDAAISTTKGCYVGQEIVARMRTYGRVNRRLVGFRFPQGVIAGATSLELPEQAQPSKIEQGRVTSSAVSRAFGPIGLGFAFREVPVGARLVAASDHALAAVVTELPFS